MPRRTKYAWALKHYTDEGWRVGVVERTYTIEGRAQTFDLFTFGDMYGYRQGHVSGICDHIIIQVTTDRSHADHLKALLANPEVERYLRATPRNHVHLISEHRDQRAPRKLGQVRIRPILRSDFG